jgi:hypothetical protein
MNCNFAFVWLVAMLEHVNALPSSQPEMTAA